MTVEGSDVTIPTALHIADVASAFNEGSLAGDQTFPCRVDEAANIYVAWQNAKAEVEDADRLVAQQQKEYAALLRSYNSALEQMRMHEKSLAAMTEAVSSARRFEPVKVKLAGVVITVEAAQ